MTYRESDNAVFLTAYELITLCLRRFSPGVPSPVSLPDGECAAGVRRRLTGAASAENTDLTLQAAGFTFHIAVPVDARTENGIVRLVPVTEDPGKPAPERVKRARSEGFLALLSVSSCHTLSVIYYNPETDAAATFTETPTEEELGRFREKIMTALTEELAPMAERRAVRMPTLAAAAFPYPHAREGQRDFMTAVYRTLCRGERLFAVAPTGTGKTVSVLYPALRALGHGHIEKVFYLTPKTTTAYAAADTLSLFGEKGVAVRSVVVTAKEKICHRHADCRDPQRPCRFRFSDGKKETAAALKLLSEEKTVVGEADIRRFAIQYGVCPYELTLRYCEFADVVICDYNYLFDLDVYMRRFFGHTGDYAFLVDEAHILAERAREMYSGEFGDVFFDDLLSLLDDKCKLYGTIKEKKDEFRSIFLPYLRGAETRDVRGVKTRFYAGRDLPYSCSSFFTALLALLDHARKDKSFTPDTRAALRRAFYMVSAFLNRLSHYDRKYTMFCTERDGALTVKVVCLDPSGVLSSRLACGRAAVFFSATLTPSDYYGALLGGGRDAVYLETASPFSAEQMAVAVLDKISVRTAEREDTLSEIYECIRSTVEARGGNYMVFCPSFAYMEVLSAYTGRHMPGVRIIRQERTMTAAERTAFLDAFSEDPRRSLIGFCVSGGIFGEGVDLAGTRLIGAVVIGIGLPALSEEREAMREYFDEKYERGREFAYVFPGMNRVLQAAGRVIRRTDDRGVIVLIDDRFAEPVYRRILPTHFHSLRFVGDAPSLSRYVRDFWNKQNM